MAKRVKKVKAKKMVRVGFIRNGLSMSTWFDETTFHSDYYVGLMHGRSPEQGKVTVVSVTRNVSPDGFVPLTPKKKASRK